MKDVVTSAFKQKHNERRHELATRYTKGETLRAIAAHEHVTHQRIAQLLARHSRECAICHPREEEVDPSTVAVTDQSRFVPEMRTAFLALGLDPRTLTVLIRSSRRAQHLRSTRPLSVGYVRYADDEDLLRIPGLGPLALKNIRDVFPVQEVSISQAS